MRAGTCRPELKRPQLRLKEVEMTQKATNVFANRVGMDMLLLWTVGWNPIRLCAADTLPYPVACFQPALPPSSYFPVRLPHHLIHTTQNPRSLPIPSHSVAARQKVHNGIGQRCPDHGIEPEVHPGTEGQSRANHSHQGQQEVLEAKRPSAGSVRQRSGDFLLPPFLVCVCGGW
jgi:hypothetical protein